MIRAILALVAGLALCLGGLGTAQADSVGGLEVMLDFATLAGAPLGTSFGKGMAMFGPLVSGATMEAQVEYDGTGIPDVLPPYHVKGGGQVRGDSAGGQYRGLFELTLAVTDGSGQPLPITQTDSAGVPIGLPTGVVRHLLNLLGPVISPTQVGVPGATVSLATPGFFSTPLGPIVLVAHPGRGTPVPEPSILVLLGAGLAGVSAAAWRRRRA